MRASVVLYASRSMFVFTRRRGLHVHRLCSRRYAYIGRLLVDRVSRPLLDYVHILMLKTVGVDS